MKIISIKIKNYRVFESLEINDIPAFCVIIGANGTGKSTLFDIFGFLRDALKNNVRQALQVRGGYKEVVTRGKEQENIEIELQFRMKILEKERLVTYVLIIGQEKNHPVVKREILRYKRGAYGSPFHFLDFQLGQGYAITNEEDFNQPDETLTREEQPLDSPDILAIKGLGIFQRFKAASAFSNLIEHWHVSDFHISDARGSKDALLYVGRWRERSYPNLKKNKKKSDSGRTLKQKACFVDKEPPICSSECHLPQTGQYQRGFSQKT